MTTTNPLQKENTTQDFVPIQEVRDGVVILKDGGLRGVFMASSINLALKSEDEQRAILEQFAQMLDSVDFSVQFVVQSRKLDIRPYIALLEKRYTEVVGDLLKIQVREYIEFVKTFSENSNIMTKSFFIVVPYTPIPLEGGVAGLLSLTKKKTPQQKIQGTGTAFEESRSQLEQRMSVVEQGLARCGVRVARLGTEEVIELFYRLFNLGELERPIPLDNRA